MQLFPCACVVPPVLFERECLFGTCGGHQITPETILLPTSPGIKDIIMNVFVSVLSMC